MSKSLLHKILRIRLYWRCQLVGWGLACTYWLYFILINGQMNFLQGFINLALTLVGCIALTHCYYLIAHKYTWHLQSINQVIPRVAIGTVLLAIVFLMFMLPINYYTGARCEGCAFMENARSQGLTILMTGLRLMAIWTLAFHMYHYAKRGAKAEAEKAQLSAMASEAQLDKLRGQLNPHFLFNALNSVKALIPIDQKKARRTTVLLSDILRNSLNASRHKYVTMEEEMQQVRDYLELEKVRFDDRLDVYYAIDTDALQCAVPPLSVHVLVENAIKHGIASRKEGGAVHVSATVADGYVKVAVENDGTIQTHNENGRTGVGLENLKARLALLYGQKATFEISRSGSHSVMAELSVPMQYIDDPVPAH